MRRTRLNHVAFSLRREPTDHRNHCFGTNVLRVTPKETYRFKRGPSFATATTRLPPNRTGFDVLAVSLPDFRMIGVVPDDAAGRRVSSGISRFLHSGAAPCSPRFALIRSQDLGRVKLGRRILQLQPMKADRPAVTSEGRNRCGWRFNAGEPRFLRRKLRALPLRRRPGVVLPFRRTDDPKTPHPLAEECVAYRKHYTRKTPVLKPIVGCRIRTSCLNRNHAETRKFSTGGVRLVPREEHVAARSRSRSARDAIRAPSPPLAPRRSYAQVAQRFRRNQQIRNARIETKAEQDDEPLAGEGSGVVVRKVSKNAHFVPTTTRPETKEGPYSLRWRDDTARDRNNMFRASWRNGNSLGTRSGGIGLDSQRGHPGFDLPWFPETTPGEFWDGLLRPMVHESLERSGQFNAKTCGGCPVVIAAMQRARSPPEARFRRLFLVGRMTSGRHTHDWPLVERCGTLFPSNYPITKCRVKARRVGRDLIASQGEPLTPYKGQQSCKETRSAGRLDTPILRSCLEAGWTWKYDAPRLVQAHIDALFGKLSSIAGQWRGFPLLYFSQYPLSSGLDRRKHVYLALAFRGCFILRVWAAVAQRLEERVLRSSSGMKGRRKRKIPEKTRRTAASSGMIPTCENPGLSRPGIEPGSPSWVAGRLDERSSPANLNRVRFPRRVAPGFSHVGIMEGDAAGRRVFSGISRFPRLCILALSPHIFICCQSTLSLLSGVRASSFVVDPLQNDPGCTAAHQLTRESSMRDGTSRRQESLLYRLNSDRCLKWLPEVRVEQEVTDQPYPRHVRWAICQTNVQAREAIIPFRSMKSLAHYSRHVAGHCSADIRHVELPEGGAESRSHVVSNGVPKHHTCLSAVPLHNAGCQIAVATVASNTYAALTVEQFEAGLVREHYILPLSTPATAFMCPLQSETCVVSGQWKPTQWHTCHQSIRSRRRRAINTDRSTPVALL
ncbi:hypothetical protein PR048_003632 [Dryococelus australis]|uniref:Uncharacterized protein n=1 Tax=Dryococelus australis TaxID=614101 RepID=A0ABQ9INM0_9NEOP|nr:hypothetical protein PR048_003632 [Dryococelus australis]